MGRSGQVNFDAADVRAAIGEVVATVAQFVELSAEEKCQVARAQQWYAQHGWTLFASRYARPIGYEFTGKNVSFEPGLGAAVGQMAVWRVVDISTKAEADRFAQFVGGDPTFYWDAATDRPFILECEAMPD